MDRFSHSSLETYKKCPTQFKIRYLDNIKKPDESIEAFMGKRIHEALEFLYNEVLEGRIPFFDHVIDKFEKEWEKNWHTRIGIVKKENTSEYYKLLGEDCLARYFRKHTPFNEPIVGNEIEINFTLDEEGGYQIKGIIDRLDHDGEGNWEIHDYKSGKRSFTQAQADEDKQLALYQLGLLDKDNEIKSIKLVWHFLQNGVEVESNRTEEQLMDLSTSIKSQIDEIRSIINNGGEFPPKKSILCNWCYYWEECPIQSGSNPFIGSYLNKHY